MPTTTKTKEMLVNALAPMNDLAIAAYMIENEMFHP
ncbi:hypothetical protein M2105_002698 [Paenibacillus sp. PastF-1]|nr:hypothetical protein [Paenibacillus sp. PastF-2]MDF9848206.1 hypothetical protein [Paenibacillus sp. PastM-2]MDF9854841.1 hypothetical protein [Paenibacillus sp. PastF-1]MDH6480111.1 hypothetical protein [Paenibacillus sp. PastH-2]MDH6507543.1 hypothetical protein [Paenibacillus sp. PastM-3]